MSKVTDLERTRLDARKQRYLQKDERWPTEARLVVTDAEYRLMLLLEDAAYRADLLVWTKASLRQIVGLNDREEKEMSRPTFSVYESAVTTFVLLTKDLSKVLLIVLKDSVAPDLRAALQAHGVPVATLADVDLATDPVINFALVTSWIRKATMAGAAVWNIERRRRPNMHHRLCSLHLRSSMRILPLQGYQFTGGLDESAVTPELAQQISEVANEIRSTYWTLLEEVPLASLIRFNAKVPNHIANFVRRSSVDAVIVLAAPIAIPLLAIEFDGGAHENETQVRKDTWKDDLLADAQIPLLRISTREVAVIAWHLADSEQRFHMSTYLNPACQIAIWIASSARDDFRMDHKLSEAYLKASETGEILSRALYGKSRANLDEVQTESLEYTHTMRTINDDLDLIRREAEFNRKLWDRNYSLETQLQRFGIDASSVHDFEIKQSGLQNLYTPHEHSLSGVNADSQNSQIPIQ